MMDTFDINAIHAAELGILKAIDELCEKHDIHYTIYCGTLLGAVRHRGFIPWDIDIDISMPLRDYRRFLRVADELPSRFKCNHYGNTRDYFNPSARVADESTTFMIRELSSMELSWGLYVDVYPMIGAAPTSYGVQLQRLLLVLARRLRMVTLYRTRGDGGVIKRMLYMVPFPVMQAVSNWLLWLVMRDPEKSKRIGTIDGAPFEGKYFWEDWQEMIRLSFEDGDFPAPANYDKVLRRMYGDYMQLPPVEQRTINDKINIEEYIIDPFKSYKEYRREILKQ